MVLILPKGTDWKDGDAKPGGIIISGTMFRFIIISDLDSVRWRIGSIVISQISDGIDQYSWMDRGQSDVRSFLGRIWSDAPIARRCWPTRRTRCCAVGLSAHQRCELAPTTWPVAFCRRGASTGALSRALDDETLIAEAGRPCGIGRWTAEDVCTVVGQLRADVTARWAGIGLLRVMRHYRRHSRQSLRL